MTDLAEMGEYIKKFVGLWKTQAKNSNAVRDATEKKNATIKAKDLKEFIKYYVSLVTTISSPYLADLADNKQLYLSLIKDYFKEEKLSDFIDTTFFNKYKGEEEIDLKSFFRSHLVTFQDDYNIRQQFANFPE